MVGRAIVLTLAATALGGATTAQAAGLNARAADQIAALQQVKQSLTPAERKLGSALVLTLRQRAGARATNALPRLQTGVAVSRAGTTEVDVRSAAAGPALAARLRRLGADVRHISPANATIRAALPLAALNTVAGWSEVRRIDVATGAIHGSFARKPVGKEARAARVEQRLQTALAAAKTPPGPQGSVVSEGDKAHAADVARATQHVSGIGVKVCALSDGVDSLTASQATGDLPAEVDVLPGEEGSGDEGTAMLEIIHDIAPGAALGFATTGSDSAEEMADNILALRARGCDVLVDDVLYFSEDPFQDGPIAQSVEAVTADGALYFSSAGNEGNTLDGTAGNWEGMFVSSGQTIGKFRGFAHDFDPSAATQAAEPLSDDSNAGVPTLLWWADPLGHARDDYDLYLLDADGNVVGASQDVQDGDDDPFEGFFTPPFGGVGLSLAVVKFSGQNRYFQLSALRGRFSDSGGLKAFVTPGVTRGHSAVPTAFSIAAAPAAEPLPFDLEPGDPPNPAGPFPNPFTSAQKPERFTSDGPRRFFFEPDGTPLAAGGVVVRKPDFTAADGVSTTLDEPFDPFFGTSASAPHAAAIAALIRSGNPGIGRGGVRQAFTAAALDLRPAGVDNRTGLGLVRADRALAHTGATPQPLVQPRVTNVKPTTGDGDAFLEPGESAGVAVQAQNVGDGTATGVNVRVDADDARATVSPRTRSYGDLVAGQKRTTPFTVALAAGYPNGRPLGLDVTVTFAGRLSPTHAHLTVPVGQPSPIVHTFAYTGPPVAIPDNSDVGATVAIPVSGVGYVSGLTFSIDGTNCTTTVGATTVGIDHTFVGDLTGVLTAPDGTPVTVFQSDGGSGNNLCKVVFDDAASTPFADVDADQAPFTGTWHPDNPLATLANRPADGTWHFQAIDGAGADTGSLRAVSLHIRGFAN
jgi:subtilisin-like proprotein convertase family protein